MNLFKSISVLSDIYRYYKKKINLDVIRYCSVLTLIVWYGLLRQSLSRNEIRGVEYRI